MSLEVLGAGFGRTGTNSLKLALERLGFAPCHHMFEVMAGGEAALAPWEALVRGGSPDWREIFAGWRAQVDWPGAAYWRELAAAFPEAKVILSVRDPEAWWRSVERTILPAIVGRVETDDPMRRRRSAMIRALINDRVFDGRADDPAWAQEVFRRHAEEVRAEIPAERLLVFRAEDGWAPLCAFLGVPVPDEPYPETNSSAAFRERFKEA